MTRAALLRAGLLVGLAAAGSAAAAGPTKVSLRAVLELAQAARSLDGTVRFVGVGEPQPEAAESFGVDVRYERTASLLRTPERSCERVALSALIALQNNAKLLGADAVIGLASRYRGRAAADPDEIECEIGPFSGQVSLKGTYVRLARQGDR